MRIVVRSVFFCANVAERPRAKGDHNERPFVNIVAVGKEGMSLGVNEITGSRIYNGQGECGRKEPRAKLPRLDAQETKHSLRTPKFPCPLPSPHTRSPRGERSVHSPPASFFFLVGTSTNFSPSRLSTLRALFRGECAGKP